MRPWTIIIVTLAAGRATDAAAQIAESFKPAAWLAGCWELRAGDRITHEQWMAPLGGAMLGMSRTVVGDRVRESEHLRIELRGDRLTYVAKPSDQAEAAFALESATDDVCETSYRDRGGKYQGQVGVTLPKI